MEPPTIPVGKIVAGPTTATSPLKDKDAAKSAKVKDTWIEVNKVVRIEIKEILL